MCAKPLAHANQTGRSPLKINDLRARPISSLSFPSRTSPVRGRSPRSGHPFHVSAAGASDPARAFRSDGWPPLVPIPVRWCKLVYVSRPNRREYPGEYVDSQVRQAAKPHNFSRLDRSIAPQWGSGGRGFKSRRPDVTNCYCTTYGDFGRRFRFRGSSVIVHQDRLGISR